MRTGQQVLHQHHVLLKRMCCNEHGCAIQRCQCGIPLPRNFLPQSELLWQLQLESGQNVGDGWGLGHTSFSLCEPLDEISKLIVEGFDTPHTGFDLCAALSCLIGQAGLVIVEAFEVGGQTITRVVGGG